MSPAWPGPASGPHAIAALPKKSVRVPPARTLSPTILSRVSGPFGFPGDSWGNPAMKRKLTAPEVADLLRLSVEHLYDLVQAGVVPAQRLHPRGKLLFDPDEVEAALRAAWPEADAVRGQGDGGSSASPQAAAVGTGAG